jgi:23S rRNA (pseudouridine1915-N3)-methyltransferase
MRIRVIVDGKMKDRHLRALESEYSERISHFIEFSVQELDMKGRPDSGSETKPSSSERRLLDKLKGSIKVFLDERGRQWTSKEFANWLGEHALRGTRELVFLVGGPEGFSPALRKQADLLLALSPMTLTHDWARTLLLEQIYRGFTILRGYPYPR